MARVTTRTPDFDRFADWPQWAARAVLALAAILLALAALTYPVEQSPSLPAPAGAAVAVEGGRDTDLLLYDRIAERVAAGDSYYAAATEEQRARNFPVRPGFAVRLPTLAFAIAWLGQEGLIIVAALLLLATLGAWWRRLGEESGGKDRRVIAMLLLLVGAAMGMKPQYLALHEVWAGMFLALSFGLHRPGRWGGALLAALLALAVREHALPFVLLMAATAGWRRDLRECAAWLALAAAFGIALAYHLAQVDALLLPTDRPSDSWLALRGIAGVTTDIVQSSSLHLLPGPVAASLAMLPLLGWAGWKTNAGLFGTLLFCGYAVFFMIAGRENNFYWGLVVTPAWFVGFAFLPLAFRSLVRRSFESRIPVRS